MVVLAATIVLSVDLVIFGGVEFAAVRIGDIIIHDDLS